MNKRKWRRFEVDNADIGITMYLARYVEVLNISLEGVSLKADRLLPIGSTCILKIKSKGKVYIAKGTIIWSSLSESREDEKGKIVPIYKAGLKFTDIRGEALNEIFRVIELKKKIMKEHNNSEHIDFELEELDIQETDKDKLGTIINSLDYK